MCSCHHFQSSYFCKINKIFQPNGNYPLFQTLNVPYSKTFCSCDRIRFHIGRKLPKMCKSEVKLIMTSGEDLSAPVIMAFSHSNDAFVETMATHF